jgi:hypothetical protein
MKRIVTLVAFLVLSSTVTPATAQKKKGADQSRRE